MARIKTPVNIIIIPSKCSNQAIYYHTCQERLPFLNPKYPNTHANHKFLNLKTSCWKSEFSKSLFGQKQIPFHSLPTPGQVPVPAKPYPESGPRLCQDDIVNACPQTNKKMKPMKPPKIQGTMGCTPNLPINTHYIGLI